jgi:Uma2 family endonuclease
MGWLIDPSEQCVFVYLPNQPIQCYDEVDQRLPTPAFATAVHLTVGELFGWLME